MPQHVAHTRARDNPFATWRLHAIRFRAPDFSWDDFELQWARNGYRGEIVGPHGSGKTQLLEECQTRLANQGHTVKLLRFNVDLPRENRLLYQPFLQQVKNTDTVLLDGAEQLGWFAWRRFRQRTSGCRAILTTTHHSGRLPTLIKTSTSPELLEELLRELLATDAEKWIPKARQLVQKHRGNLRDVFRELYDVYGLE